MLFAEELWSLIMDFLIIDHLKELKVFRELSFIYNLKAELVNWALNLILR